MIQTIIRDEAFLAIPSTTATPDDIAVGQDLFDTLTANADRCVGLAANMIGVSCRVIIIDNDGTYLVMYNPELLKGTQPYDTEECCLSLDGARPTKRFRTIKVRYQNEAFQTRIKNFSEFPAQIIQHELDHCDGIII